MPPRAGLALLLAALAPGCATTGSPPGAAAGAPPLRLRPEVRPIAYRLEITADPEAEGFGGQVEIDVALPRGASAIWLNGLALAVEEARIQATGAAVPAAYRQVTPEGVARLTPEWPLPPGTATIRLRYSAAWGSAAGLLRARHAGRAYAATRLEPAGARRAFPCFDEPGFDAPFEVALRVPRGLVAISNGPAVAEEPSGDGWVRIRFAPTPPLPTSLLFAAAGPFDVLEGPEVPPSELRPRALPLRVLAPAGERDRAVRALEATVSLLPWMERWLGTGFPHARLDQVAVPGLAAPGMENAGAIACSDSRLLADTETPPAQREATARTVAHEIAHRWLGDLVTLHGWDDLWLNESLATFLEVKSVEAVLPELGPLTRAQAALGWVMGEDSLARSRAVRQPVSAADDAAASLDAPSCGKGAAVLRMVERWMGEERFRAAVRAWVGAHAHATGTTEALISALSRGAGRDLGPELRDFLDRPGVPHLDARVACESGRAQLELVQERWLPIGSRADANVQWELPLCVRYGLAGEPRESCALVGGPHAALPLPGCPDWLLPDAGGAGYWLWSLAPDDLERLRARGLPHLGPGERLSYARALAAGARSGHLPLGEALSHLAPLARDPEERVAEAPLDLLATAIDDLLPAEQRPRARAVAAAIYRPVGEELGWEPAPGESAARRGFRERVLRFLVQTARDPAARRTAAAMGRDHAGLELGRFRPEAVSPELAGLALSVAAADPAVFEALERRLGETEDPALRLRLLEALGAATAPALSRRALSLVADPRLRPEERVEPLAAQAARPETRAAAFESLRGHYHLVAGDASAASRLPQLASGFCDRARAAEVQAFFRPRAARLPGGERRVDRVVERIELCAALRESQAASAAAWFAGR